MSPAQPAPADGRRNVRALAGLALATALLPAAAGALACTPPRPFDLSLTLSATVAGDGALMPGSRGRLVFTAWNLRGTRGPEGFEVRQAAHDPQAPDAAPIRLVAAPGAECVVQDRDVTVNGELRRLQAVVAPRDRNAIWPRNCHVDFEVMPGAVAGQAVRYTLVLQDFCGVDVEAGNNTADVVFGVVPPPAQPARPAPLAPWPLAALILAILAGARAARRHRAVAVDPG